jgi:hypothetical protein
MRPIAIGTALRRTIAALVAHNIKPVATRLLLPTGQYGIGISGGIDFVIATTLIQLEHLVDTPHPTHALLLADITNMFHVTLRDACETKLRD